MAEPVYFPTTMWSTISRAKVEGRDALERICTRYRTPIRAFLLSHGFREADADDVTQQVFLRVLEDDVLLKADRALGKFRSLLLGVTRNIVREMRRHDHALKRGGDKGRVSLDDRGPDDAQTAIAEIIAAEQQDEGFDRLWIMNLLDLALRRLKTDGGPHGETYFDVLKMRVIEHMDYDAIAARIGKAVTDVKNFLHRGREKVKSFVLDLIREYSSTQTEYETEIRYLAQFLPKAGGEGGVL